MQNCLQRTAPPARVFINYEFSQGHFRIRLVTIDGQNYIIVQSENGLVIEKQT